MKLITYWIVAAIAIALGVWHIQVAMQAIFVFREGESILSWLAILLGPATTLLAVILAMFRRTIGGYWLIGSGTIAFVIFAMEERGLTDHVVAFLVQFSAPMILIGGGFLAVQKYLVNPGAKQSA